MNMQYQAENRMLQQQLTGNISAPVMGVAI
jgi:hypothetical protein